MVHVTVLTFVWNKIQLHVFSLQHWTKLNISGAKPPVRNCHAACCIAGPLTGQYHPQLMVIGGWYTDASTLGDVWLLDVDKGVWSEVGMLCIQ